MIAEVLRDVRLRNGLSVRGLARVAGVSPATVDRLEHRRVSPTRSVDQILASVGCRLVVTAERIAEPPLTREDRRSLAFHRAVAQRFLADPGSVRTKARRNLATMRAAHEDGRSQVYFDRWEDVLDGSDADLVSLLLSTADDARSMRQVTPFAGVLSPDERRAVFSGRNGDHAT